MQELILAWGHEGEKPFVSWTINGATSIDDARTLVRRTALDS